MGREHHQFRSVPPKVIGIATSPTIFELQIAAFCPAKLLKSIQKGLEAGLKFQIALGCLKQHADTPHPLALLRPRSKRPCRRTADKTDELAPPHCRPGGH